ncbi:MAG: hypothetical protein IT159_12280 [Bryobacterales bacterium]|nr:hypothetical protein [Bryobacterales bacterium]
MKSPGQLSESIERFRSGFWRREAVDRPPVSVIPAGAWLPIRLAREPIGRPRLLPEDVSERLARTDYEQSARERRVESDDFIPYAAAWRAIPWLEAMCGCPVRTSAGSLAPAPCVESPEDLEEAAVPADSGWVEALRRETARLCAAAPEDCWVSPTILRGASDVLAAMCGLDRFFLALHDNRPAVARAAARVNALHMNVLDTHFSLVQPRLGGHGHIFGFWAPGPATVIQEDALGMCSPAVYRDEFMPLSAQLVERLGRYVLFHLHSTGYRHYRHVLDVPGLAGLEITVEANGPPLRDMAPALGEILNRSRLILSVDGYFEQLPEVLRRLPRDGLYLIVSGEFVRSETEFKNLLGTFS